MSAYPLLVAVSVAEEYMPLVDALLRLRHDVGSVAASKVRRMMANPEMLPPLDPAIRLLCVATADKPAMNQLMVQLALELSGTPFAEGQKMGRVVLIGLPLDAALAVFIDIPTVTIQ
jgi:hypothetical protein